MSKASEIHSMKDEELVEALKRAHGERFALRIKHSTGELENTASLGVSKRDFARLLTVARQRGIDVEKELTT